jgi:hypothetical protein
VLTEQHRFASKITHSQHRIEFKQHMCGLCHALGQRYGLLSRFLTSHDMVLLSLLISSQRKEAASVAQRRCPLNPVLRVSCVQDETGAIVSAIALALARASLQDHVLDGKGNNLKERPARWYIEKRYPAALEILSQNGFRTDDINNLASSQFNIEKEGKTSLGPTAQLTAHLLGMTARLTGNPTNQEALERIGYAYGSYIYLFDAFTDFPKDMLDNQFNPLREYAIIEGRNIVLSEKGVNWLKDYLYNLFQEIRVNLGTLKLYHDQDLISDLFTRPVNKFLDILSKDDLKDGLFFYQVKTRDILALALMVNPVVMPSTFASETLDKLLKSPKIAHLAQNLPLTNGPFSSWFSSLLQDNGDTVCGSLCGGPTDAACGSTCGLGQKGQNGACGSGCMDGMDTCHGCLLK